MNENIDHAKIDQNLQFKYALRLLSIAEANDFEGHLIKCDNCAKQLAEITRFFELLQQSISNHNSVVNPAEKLGVGIKDESGHAAIAENRAIESMLQNPANHQLEDLLAVLKGCFNGFQKLRNNISAQMNDRIEPAQIEQAALEILLALPRQVSKI